MGQTLSDPVTTKESSTVSNEKFFVGSSSMQGWRVTMEDTHVHYLNLPEDPDAAFFAVYDGHGGSGVAKYAGKHLHNYIVQRKKHGEKNYEEAIKMGFLDFDAAMLADPEMSKDPSGSTAVCALIVDDSIYCGNVGDSRCVASVNGTAMPLSIDHKPGDRSEAQRIVAAGGWVENERVNGNLSLSRAVGDFSFKTNEDLGPKEQAITAYPDVQKHELSDEWEFLVLACDGIWDVLSNQSVVSFIRSQLAEESEPAVICENLINRCLAPDLQMDGLGCDNMTVVLVCFLNGKPFGELCRRVKETSTSFLPQVEHADKAEEVS